MKRELEWIEIPGEHEARETALYAAVAKALGKDAAAVRDAFEANEPTRP